MNGSVPTPNALDADAGAPAGSAAPRAKERQNSYGQILKSSAIIGGSSVVGIAVGIVRAKAMALLLGPAGVGLVGLYSSIAELTHSIAGMGINSSGVRQIADAVGSGDTGRVAKTAAVLRRTSVALGLLGAIALVVLSRPASQWTFGTPDYAVPVALMSLTVWLRLVSNGQGALIQGMRRIADLARIAVYSALLGTVATVLLVYVFREDGVVPSLVAAAAITVVISWWYRRKIDIPHAPLTVSEAREGASALLSLGFAFMASAVLTTGAAYAIRVIVRDAAGIEAAGLYQSAWALGGMYVGFILQAMGSDFYPRLTAVARDHDECNRLVNEQAHIGLLMAGPGVIGTLTFAPAVIAIFYASTFSAAVNPLRWICLGMAMRVVAWPMGFIILAKGAQAAFFWTEVAATLVHVGLAFVLVRWLGLDGATMAFFGLYVWHSVLVYFIVRRMTGFRWTRTNVRLGMVYLPLIAGVFLSCLLLPIWPSTAIGVTVTIATGIHSLRVVCRLVTLDRLPRMVRRVLAWSRIVPGEATPVSSAG